MAQKTTFTQFGLINALDKALDNEQGLTAYEHHILLTMWLCMRQDTKMYVSYSLLSEKSRLSISTVKRSLNGLLERELITKKAAPKGSKTPNTYQLNLVKLGLITEHKPLQTIQLQKVAQLQPEKPYNNKKAKSISELIKQKKG